MESNEMLEKIYKDITHLESTIVYSDIKPELKKVLLKSVDKIYAIIKPLLYIQSNLTDQHSEATEALEALDINTD
jgi:hypothetical protein